MKFRDSEAFSALEFKCMLNWVFVLVCREKHRNHECEIGDVPLIEVMVDSQGAANHLELRSLMNSDEQ